MNFRSPTMGCIMIRISCWNFWKSLWNMQSVISPIDPPVWFSWKHRCEYEQGLGWDRVREAQRSNESPSGAFKRQRGLRQQMEGPRPDKFYKCFRIVKTQKTSRGCSAHVMGSPFAPNEVPAPVCAAALTKSRYHVRSAHEIFKVQLPKRKIPPTQRSDDFVG